MRFGLFLCTLLLACGDEEPPAKKAKPTKAVKAKPTPTPKATTAKIDSDHPGAKVYTEVCQSCHQISGKGLGSAYPPLVGSEWLSKPDGLLIRIALHGLRGPIKVAGKEYGSMEMNIPEPLTDIQIADVLSFTRSYFGKFEKPITPEQVKEVRDAYPKDQAKWTAETLQPFEAKTEDTKESKKSATGKKSPAKPSK